ncbi:MAG: type II toxin-antitoxin system VapC family toxin [Betaproteobacteria bacterium]|nr:type II toxin-antitoxin system VapC family toxin [Betaproteobacteria bacterium]
MKIAADSNVVLRFLLADDEKQAASARRALQGADRVILTLPVLCEVVWTLSRGYKLDAASIAEALAVLLRSDKVAVNRGAVDAGLAMLIAGGDFADGAIAHEGMTLGAQEFVTFDRQAATLLKKKGAAKVRLLA